MATRTAIATTGPGPQGPGPAAWCHLLDRGSVPPCGGHYPLAPFCPGGPGCAGLAVATVAAVSARRGADAVPAVATLAAGAAGAVARRRVVRRRLGTRGRQPGAAGPIPQAHRPRCRRWPPTATGPGGRDAVATVATLTAVAAAAGSATAAAGATEVPLPGLAREAARGRA